MASDDIFGPTQIKFSYIVHVVIEKMISCAAKLNTDSVLMNDIFSHNHPVSIAAQFQTNAIELQFISTGHRRRTVDIDRRFQADTGLVAGAFVVQQCGGLREEGQE